MASSFNPDKKVVLVTGAGGYIGAHVVRVLLENGYTVRGTVRNVTDERKVKPIKDLSTKDDQNLHLVEADLLKPDTWHDAVKGCDYVMHVASPFVLGEPKNPDDLIKPAIEGTLNVLKACAGEHSAVKRVVLTSSIAAVFGDITKTSGAYDETDWTDARSSVTTYNKSKTLAERAAWDFVRDNKCRFELAVVNPGFVAGPLLHDSDCTSADIVKNILIHDMPMVPKLQLPVVDVRDVALGHLRAMTVPEAAGHRHLLVSNVLWFKDMADILDKEFKSQGYKIPTKVSPLFLLKIMSLFDSKVKPVVADYGKQFSLDTSRMKNVLGISPIDANTTLVDMAYSLIERGFVKKTSKYRPRKLAT